MSVFIYVNASLCQDVVLPLINICIRAVPPKARPSVVMSQKLSIIPQVNMRRHMWLGTWQKASESRAGLTNDCLLARSAAAATGRRAAPSRWQIDREQIVSDTALRDRALTDRWDRGSSQGSRGWRGLIRYTEEQMGGGPRGGADRVTQNHREDDKRKRGLPS